MRVALLLLLLLSLGAIPGSLIPQSGERRDEGRRLPQGQPHPRGRLRQARPLPRLQLGVVLRDLHPAVRLPHRLHRAPHLAVRRPAARPAAGRPPAADPAARLHHLAHRRRARAGPRGRPRPAEEAPLPRPPHRGRRRRREGLSARGRQPRLPHRPDRDADRLRLGPALQVRGQQAGRRGRRLLQHPHPVRRLQVRQPLHAGRPGAVQLQPGRLHRHLRDERSQQGHPAHLPGRPSPTASGAYGKDEKTTVKVNEPLEIGDSKVYLIAHGYAPVITVRDAKGEVVYSDAVPLLPLDSNVTSSGVDQGHGRLPQRQGRRRNSSASTAFFAADLRRGQRDGLDVPRR